jgi:hypothetical protein
MYNPVGIRTLSRGFNTSGSPRLALISIPADPDVSYSGKEFFE